MSEQIQEHTATLHRTDHYSPEQIRHLQESANKQEQAIARVFFKNPGRAFGPTRIHQALFPGFPDRRGDWAITSTRRAITNLTTAGILIMTKETRPSLLKGSEHLWRWRDPKKNPRTHAELLAYQKAHGQMNFYEQMVGGEE